MKPSTVQALPGTTRDPLYPDSDGRPMGDTDFHSVAMIALRRALECHFADDPDFYVATNLLFYFEQGNPSARRDPDVLAAKCVGKHKRRSFRVWEEKAWPSVLFEIASENTWRIDVGEKRDLYARLAIPEYFLFDPEGPFLNPPLQGFRLKRKKYTPLKPAADGSLVSEQLDLRLVPEGEMLRLIDVRTGRRVLTRAEQAEQERDRATDLAAEVKRLRRLLGQQEPPGRA